MAIKYSIHMIWLIVLILLQCLSVKCNENVTIAEITSSVNSSGEDVALKIVSNFTEAMPIYSLVTKNLPNYLRQM